MSSFAAKAAGGAFSSFILAKFGKQIAAPSSSIGFSLIAAFGRCRFRLNDTFVADSLCSILGCPAASLRVSALEDRIFLFTVSCKDVGLEIYRIRNFSCDKFELFFQLFNDSGLASARSLASDKPPPSAWVEVSKKHAPAAVLTGANQIAIGSKKSAQQDSNPSGSFFPGLNQNRTSIFERISLPKRSVFYRLSWGTRSSFGSQNVSVGRPGRSNHLTKQGRVLGVHPARQAGQARVRQTGQVRTQRPSDSNLDLSLKLQLGPSVLVLSEANEAVLSAVLCSRCLSSSHTRQACTARIKCYSCLGWGHIAASCTRQWANLQDSVAGRELDNFSRFSSKAPDCSNWFKSFSMTVGPSSPPRFSCWGEAQGVAPSSHTVQWVSFITQAANSALQSPENPNYAVPPPVELSLGDFVVPPPQALPSPSTAMAYQRANPSIFDPRNYVRLEVPGRKVMSRAVMIHPQPKNLDLAIVSIEPLPGHQVTFGAIRGVVVDFLNLDRRVQFTDIQPTHLGQAYVRFSNSLDRDRLIHIGTTVFGDVTLTFTEHNKGRNWRAINFNRECWLMLLGFPPDYREDEFVVNAINSFGRVINWIYNPKHLSKLFARVRVIDLESVPQFLVLTEGEGFQGESWTVQCEILQGDLLGGLPADEDLVPEPDDLNPDGPFDFFGFGQQGPGRSLWTKTWIMLVGRTSTWSRLGSGMHGQTMFTIFRQ